MLHFDGTLVLLKREQPDFEAAARTVLAKFDGGLDRLTSEQLERGLSPPSVADAAPRVKKRKKGVCAQGAAEQAPPPKSASSIAAAAELAASASNSASASTVAACQWDEPEPESEEEDFEPEGEWVERVWGDEELRQEEAAHQARLRREQNPLPKRPCPQDALASLPNSPERTQDAMPAEALIIGISGCTRSGKSTLATALQQELGLRSSRIICQDTFASHALASRQESSWEATGSIDHAGMREALNTLRANGEVTSIIVEGFRAFHDPEIVAAMDLLIWLNVSREVCLARRTATKPVSVDTFSAHLWPRHEEYERQCFDIGGPMAHDSSMVTLQLDGERTTADHLKWINKILLTVPGAGAQSMSSSAQRQPHPKSRAATAVTAQTANAQTVAVQRSPAVLGGCGGPSERQQQPPQGQQLPPKSLPSLQHPGHILNEGNGYATLTNFFDGDLSLVQDLLSKKATKAETISGGTVQIPAQGQIAIRIQECARLCNPIATAVKV